MYKDEVCLSEGNCANIEFCGLLQLAGPSVIYDYSGVLGLNGNNFTNATNSTYSFVENWAKDTGTEAVATFIYDFSADGS